MLSPGADGGDGWERAGRIGGVQKRLRLAQSRPVVVLSAGVQLLRDLVTLPARGVGDARSDEGQRRRAVARSCAGARSQGLCFARQSRSDRHGCVGYSCSSQAGTRSAATMATARRGKAGAAALLSARSGSLASGRAGTPRVRKPGQVRLSGHAARGAQVGRGPGQPLAFARASPTDDFSSIRRSWLA
jgi:hypothetical protein